jgi:hypothetical protein
MYGEKLKFSGTVRHQGGRSHGRLIIPLQYENIPFDKTCRMSRGPHINPGLYSAIKQKIQSLDNTAARMPLPESTNRTNLQHCIR